ncbi:MAG: hypothetical protein ACRDZ3_04450 [Acidimicrobiia bacterium]
MRISKKLVAVGVVVGSLAVAGVGYAYWSASGTGSAGATTTEAVDSTVTASATLEDGLWPGGPTVPVHFSVNNENPYSVTFDSFDTPVIQDPAGDCSASDFALVSVTDNLLDDPVVVAAGDSESGSASILRMVEDAPDACQNVAVTVKLNVVGMQTDVTP